MIFADKIKPVRGQVLIRMEMLQPTGMIEIPDQFREVSNTGMVVETGAKPRTLKGIEAEHEVNPGDRVILSKHSGRDLEISGRPHKLVAEWEILAVLN